MERFDVDTTDTELEGNILPVPSEVIALLQQRASEQVENLVATGREALPSARRVILTAIGTVALFSAGAGAGRQFARRRAALR